MNRYQKYLNDEYRHSYDDANYLTDEEVALMNPAGESDEKAFWYQERFREVVDAKRKVEILIDYIRQCRNLMYSANVTNKEKEELQLQINALFKELNEAKKKLAHAKYNSDELNTLFERKR